MTIPNEIPLSNYAHTPQHHYQAHRHNHNHTSPHRSNYYSNTEMWICHMCHDGPKVYNNQTTCVMCGHDVCFNCTRVK
ncbi:hypothetical protein BJX70DRAFT_374931 [Aspergillus crustosus]